MKLSQLLLSAAHNATACAVSATAPIAVSLVQQGPTGNALTYAQHHPWVLGLWAFGAMIARDQLKNVPAFASASGTVSFPVGGVGTTAATADNTPAA